MAEPGDQASGHRPLERPQGRLFRQPVCHARHGEAGLDAVQGGRCGTDQRRCDLHYRNDPDDSNLRIAPSLPPVAELEKAMEVLCLSLRLAALEKLLAK